MSQGNVLERLAKYSFSNAKLMIIITCHSRDKTCSKEAGFY